MKDEDIYETIINGVESARESFLNNVDMKNSTVEILENGKIVIFPVMKNNLSLKQARKQLARKLAIKRPLM